MAAIPKIKRQVDILIEDEIAGFPFKIVVDAKYFSRKIDVKCVESFISMFDDIEANCGLLVTCKGYSEAALNSALFGPQKVELDILNFDPLLSHQHLASLPYSGQFSLATPDPFGWVIDNQRRRGVLAAIYQRGLNLKSAQDNLEWMYVNFWRKDKYASTISELLEMQNSRMIDQYPDLKPPYVKTADSGDS